jgi:hypothetical protein
MSDKAAWSDDGAEGIRYRFAQNTLEGKTGSNVVIVFPAPTDGRDNSPGCGPCDLGGPDWLGGNYVAVTCGCKTEAASIESGRRQHIQLFS